MLAPLLAPAALAFAPVADVTVVSLTDAGQAAVVVEAAPPIVQPGPAAPPPAGGATVAPGDSAVSSGGTTESAAAGRHRHASGDPLEGFNRTMFGIHQAIDHAAFRPVAMGYKTVVPKPVRSGLRHLLSNLTEPFIFINFLLQGKPGKAGETLGRFLINSTFGLGGLVDVAKTRDFNLPHRPNGFGTTLGFYGVGPGPYIFLPFVGPTTLRDLFGNSADDALLPLVVGHPFNSMEYQLVAGGVGGLDLRAESDPELRALFDGAVDPYATLRSVYLQNRAGEIEDAKGRGHPGAGDSQAPADELADPLSDPELTGAVPEAQPGAVPQSSSLELRDPLDDPAGTPPTNEAASPPSPSPASPSSPAQSPPS